MKQETIPVGLAGVREKYGNPRDRDGSLNEDWLEDNIVYLDLPYPMRLAWDHRITVKRLRCHKHVKADLEKRLEAVWAHARSVVKKKHGYKRTTDFYDEQSLKWLQSQNLDLFGGCFEFRMQRGVNVTLSTHCWGIAVDFDPAHNPFGGNSTLPDWFVKIWTTPDASTGLYWVWGGKFRKRDPMHFQMCKNY